MLFTFKDIDNAGLYTKSRVVIVAGQHLLFNRILVDKIRTNVKKEGTAEVNNKNSLMAEFFGDEEEDTSSINQGSIDFDTFFRVINTPSLFGKWYCCTEYQFLNKKDKERLKAYIKKPSDNGVLVVIASEWRDIKELRRLQSLRSSQFSHLVELGYPGKKQLYDIVSQMFRENGKNVGEMAIKIFIMRMSTAYDEYEETIQLVSDNLEGKKDVSYNDMKEAMRGIENFIMDDFIKALLKPINSIKVVKRRKVYKILDSLRDELTAREIVGKLKYRIRDLIEYRENINNGNIPIKGRYNAEKVKERLSEDSKIKKAGSLVFKRNAYMASMTSIGDWLFMYNILDKVSVNASEEQYLHALIALIHRGIMSNDRLMNEMLIKNTLQEGLVGVNELFFTAGWQSLRRTTDAKPEELDTLDGTVYDKGTGEILSEIYVPK